MAIKEGSTSDSATIYVKKKKKKGKTTIEYTRTGGGKPTQTYVAQPKTTPAVKRDAPPRVPTILDRNIAPMTLAYQKKYGKLPTAQQAYDMLHGANGVVPDNLWDKFVQVMGVDNDDPLTNRITEAAETYFRTYHAWPNPNKMRAMLEAYNSLPPGQPGAMGIAGLIGPVIGGPRDTSDITAESEAGNKAARGYRARHDGWTRKDIKQMKKMGLGETVKDANELRKLANTKADDKTMTQAQIDKIWRARAWYTGMGNLQTGQIGNAMKWNKAQDEDKGFLVDWGGTAKKNAMVKRDGLFNDDKSPNYAKIRALGDIPGMDKNSLLSVKNYAKFREHVAGEKWEDLSAEQRDKLMSLAAAIQEINPQFKTHYFNGQMVWDEYFERNAMQYIFLVAAPYALSNEKAVGAEAKKRAMALISVASYGQIEAEDDLYKMLTGGMGQTLGQRKNINPVSDQISQFKYYAYSKTWGAGLPLYSQLAGYVQAMGYDDLPESLKTQYDNAKTVAGPLLQMQDDSPVNPFNNIFQNILKTQFYNPEMSQEMTDAQKRARDRKRWAAQKKGYSRTKGNHNPNDPLNKATAKFVDDHVAPVLADGMQLLTDFAWAGERLVDFAMISLAMAAADARQFVPGSPGFNSGGELLTVSRDRGIHMVNKSQLADPKVREYYEQVMGAKVVDNGGWNPINGFRNAWHAAEYMTPEDIEYINTHQFNLPSANMFLSGFNANPEDHKTLRVIASIGSMLMQGAWGDKMIGTMLGGGKHAAIELSKMSLGPRLAAKVDEAEKALKGATHAARYIEDVEDNSAEVATLLDRAKFAADNGDEVLAQSFRNRADNLAARSAARETYALVARPRFWDPLSTALSRTQQEAHAIARYLDIPIDALPVKKAAKVKALVETIANSTDEDEILLAFNRLKHGYGIDIDSGMSLWTKAHELDKAIKGDDIAHTLRYKLPEGTTIKGGATKVPDYMVAIAHATSGGMLNGKEANDLLNKYLKLAWNISGENAAQANFARQQLFRQFMDEIVGNFAKKELTQKEADQLWRWAKLSGLVKGENKAKFFKALQNGEGMMTQENGLKVFEAVMNRSGGRGGFMDDMMKSGSKAYYDEFDTGNPFLMPHPGTGQGGQLSKNLTAPYNFHNMSAWARGARARHMFLYTRFGMGGVRLPSYMGVVNATKLLAIGRAFFAFTAMMVDEIPRIPFEWYNGNISANPLKMRKMMKLTEEMDMVDSATDEAIHEMMRGAQGMSMIDHTNPDYLLHLNGYTEMMGKSAFTDEFVEFMDANPGLDPAEFRARFKRHLMEKIYEDSEEGRNLRMYLASQNRGLRKAWVSPEKIQEMRDQWYARMGELHAQFNEADDAYQAAQAAKMDMLNREFAAPYEGTLPDATDAGPGTEFFRGGPRGGEIRTSTSQKGKGYHYVTGDKKYADIYAEKHGGVTGGTSSHYLKPGSKVYVYRGEDASLGIGTLADNSRASKEAIAEQVEAAGYDALDLREWKYGDMPNENEVIVFKRENLQSHPWNESAPPTFKYTDKFDTADVDDDLTAAFGFGKKSGGKIVGDKKLKYKNVSVTDPETGEVHKFRITTPGDGTWEVHEVRGNGSSFLSPAFPRQYKSVREAQEDFEKAIKAEVGGKPVTNEPIFESVDPFSNQAHIRMGGAPGKAETAAFLRRTADQWANERYIEYADGGIEFVSHKKPITDDQIIKMFNKLTDEEKAPFIHELKQERFARLAKQRGMSQQWDEYQQLKAKADEARRVRREAHAAIAEHEGTDRGWTGLMDSSGELILSKRGSEWLDAAMDKFDLWAAHPELMRELRSVVVDGKAAKISRKDLKAIEARCAELSESLGHEVAPPLVVGVDQTGAHAVGHVPILHEWAEGGLDAVPLVGRATKRLGEVPLVGKPAHWLTSLGPYTMLDRMSNATKRMMFVGNMSKHYDELVKMGMSADDAAEMAAIRAEKYADSVMYSAGSMPWENDLKGVIMFLPAYRQAAMYWGKQFAQHPLLMTRMRDLGNSEALMGGYGDYTQYLPTPFWMSGKNLGEAMLPGLSMPLLFPLRVANTLTGFRKQADGRYKYTGATKLDWIGEQIPFLSFMNKGVSPLSGLDDLWWGITGDEGYLGALEGTENRGLAFLYGVTIALRTDPEKRRRVAHNILQAQISAGKTPDITAAQAEIEGSPWWYRFFKDALNVKRPEGAMAFLSRTFGTGKLNYQPSDLSDDSPGWQLRGGADGSIWDEFWNDDEALTMADADYRMIMAYGDEKAMKDILKKYPKYAKKWNYYKLNARQKEEYLMKPENYWLIPYVTGKNDYGMGGETLSNADYIRNRREGIIIRKACDDYIDDIQKTYEDVSWSERLTGIEETWKTDKAAATKWVMRAAKRAATNPKMLEEYMKEARLFTQGFIGKGVPDQWRDGDWKVPWWLQSAALKAGFDPANPKDRAKWDPMFVDVRYYAQMKLTDAGKAHYRQDNGNVNIEIEGQRPYYSVVEQGEEKGRKVKGIEGHWTNGAIYDKNFEENLGKIGRTTEALEKLMPKRFKGLFSLKNNMSYGTIKEMLKDREGSRNYNIRAVAGQPQYYFTDPASEMESVGINVGDHTKFNTLWQKAQNLYSDFSYDTEKMEYGSDEYIARRAAYIKAIDSVYADPQAAPLRNGPAGRLMQTYLTETHKRDKAFINNVVSSVLSNDKAKDYNKLVDIRVPKDFEDANQYVAAHAWMSVLTVAVAFRQAMRKTYNESMEANGISTSAKDAKPYVGRLTALANAWRRRSPRFRKMWDDMGGVKLIDSFLDYSN